MDLDSRPPRPLQGNEQGVTDEDGVLHPWEETFDAVVVGFGGAGAAAAIEAHDNGAEVLLVDRFRGGGSTKLSGGIYYAGAGTEVQEKAGYRDDPENMYRYVKQEADGAVSDVVLRAFCEQSPENFEWMKSHGIPFVASGKAYKTSYPPDDCTLYFSGNELCWPYNEKAEPAPRGHRPIGHGLTGNVLFKGLQDAVHRRGIDVWSWSRAERLVVDDNGDVLGVWLQRARFRGWNRLLQQLWYNLVMLGSLLPRLSQSAQRRLIRLERRVAKPVYVRARRGVVLATGGFAFNRAMMRRYAPDYVACSMRLGQPGDIGDGIRLGQSVGGQVGNMDRCSAFIFINPPSAWVRGVIVGRNGERICNEEYYGSTIGVHMVEKAGGKAVLVLDADAMKAAREQMHTEYMGGYQKYAGYLNHYINRKKAWTIEELEEKCGFSAGRLVRVIDEYNEGVRAGRDAWGKSEKYLYPVENAPFYAINLDVDERTFMTPHFTIGGLRVEDLSQRVLREDGSPVEGLYAAGRTAVGVSSHSYVSGLSVADCIFSGRNAGRALAGRAAGESDGAAA